MALRLGIAQINVTDLATARTFYEDSLGFKVRERFGPTGAFELDTTDGPTILIYPVEKAVPAGYPNQTGTVLVFFTDDIDRTVRDWQSKGVAFIKIAWSEDEGGIAETPYGRFIAFRDPSGNVHELLEPR